ESAAGFYPERLHDRREEFLFRPDQPINGPGTQPRRGSDVPDGGDLVALFAELGSCDRTNMRGFVVAAGLTFVAPRLDCRLGGSEGRRAIQFAVTGWPSGQAMQHDAAQHECGLIGGSGVPNDVEPDVHNGLTDAAAHRRYVNIRSYLTAP